MPLNGLNGLIAFRKPSGMGSTDLLNILKAVLDKVSIHGSSASRTKVGHGGTLDPLASGVLVVGLGRGTKALHDQLGATVKGYRATARFGEERDSYDSDGKVISEASVDHLTRAMVEAALVPFRGKQEQAPPLYSALQMDGKRLYDYAREGKPLPRAIEKRPVEAHSLELIDFAREPATEARLELLVSSGYYVRSLIHDLGLACGSLAHMTALERTRQGDFGRGGEHGVMDFEPVHEAYKQLKAGVKVDERTRQSLEEEFQKYLVPVGDTDEGGEPASSSSKRARSKHANRNRRPRHDAPRKKPRTSEAEATGGSGGQGS